MTKELCTTIDWIGAEPWQRLLVVSDIHGHLNRLIQLLRKMDYGGDDILVIVGDLIDKGPESLRVVQYVMDLCRQHLVYVSMGNVDLSRLNLILDDSPDTGEEFVKHLRWSKAHWGGSFAQDMLADMGVNLEEVTEENAPEYRRKIREHFRRELNFLKNCPVILTAGHYLFVHGGVPTDDLSELERGDAVSYLKNDDFWNQGHRFKKYTVVTGHWPTCLYRQDREDVSPLFDPERRIVCIDGGCGVKRAGQLNGLILPDCMADMDEISWMSCDERPLVRASEPQEEAPASLHIQYFDSRVELLETRGDMAKFRHLSTGEILELPRKWMYDGKTSLHCNDYSDERLAVTAGDELSVIFETERGRYVKKQGRIGWYFGAAEPVRKELMLVRGGPEDDCFRRERELEVYELLDRLGIVFDRIDHDEANTMEACQAVDAALNNAASQHNAAPQHNAASQHTIICKNLFLCNQQRTKFYLLMMPEDKKFKTKELSSQIQSARLSFGEAVYMEKFLHITPGSVSVMGLMNDRDNQVQLLIDRQVLQGEWFGCHPCMNTSSIRLKVSDLLEKFLPAVHHEPIFVELNSD